jgi:hypothetical protein
MKNLRGRFDSVCRSSATVPLPLPIAKTWPFGLNATLVTRLPSARVVRCLVVVSHRLMWPLASPAARVCPSGLNGLKDRVRREAAVQVDRVDPLAQFGGHRQFAVAPRRCLPGCAVNEHHRVARAQLAEQRPLPGCAGRDPVVPIRI